MARRETNKYFLAEGITGNGEACPINTHNDKYLTVYGTFTSVTIQILAADALTWVPIQDGFFEEPEARLLLGIPKSCTLRAVIVGASATVELTR